MELNTSEGKMTMLYAIPGITQLPVSAGDTVDINFTHGWAGGFSMTAFARKRLIHASAKISWPEPVRVAINDDIDVYQRGGAKGNLSLNTETYRLPVVVSYNGKEVPVNDSGAATIVIGGLKYRLQVLLSIETIPDPEDMRCSGGREYWLEYTIGPDKGAGRGLSPSSAKGEVEAE
jgi:hypothetical protein